MNIILIKNTLYNCRFTQLSAGVFEGLPKLRSLSIIGAKSLQRLEEYFFLRLTKLESLILSDSGLREFPLDGICSLQKLQVEGRNWFLFRV
ncbi:unnamed protein product [Meloidogyne enterolobii]|uniref:Uncharacterized protein n=1 Tax=Meloidogyne enterolobii TaxID=390850 RepID=A0ACB0XNQ1_MELEN